ncbi:MAG: hypothetical protein EXS67_05235 [Candidatus Margulisbacteria bacterium]|nr:hypothetical protein [Candidatus Margulisiibacteriota bacterium]
MKTLGVVVVDLPGAPYMYGAMQVLAELAPAEIVVIVHGEEDDAWFWVETYPQARVLVHPIYACLSVTCNDAVALLKTDVVFFWEPSMLVDQVDMETVYAYLNRADCGAVVPTIWKMSGLEFKRVSLNEKSIRDGLFLFESEYDGAIFPSSVEGFSVAFAPYMAFFVNRLAYLRVGGMDARIAPAYGGDRELGCRLLDAGYKIFHTETVVFRQVDVFRWDRDYALDYVMQLRLRNAYLTFWQHARGFWVWPRHLGMVILRLLTFRISHCRAILKALWLSSFGKSPRMGVL